MLQHLLLSLALLLGFPVQAQESGAQTDPAALREALRAAVTEAEDGDPEWTATLRAALTSLDTAEQLTREATQARAQAQAAPGAIEALREELAQATEEALPEVPPDAALADLEVSLQTAQQELTGLQARVDELAQTASTRVTRLGQLPGEIAAAQTALGAATEKAGAVPAQGARPGEREAASAAVLEASARLDALNAELELIQAETQLLPLQRDQAARQLLAAQARFDFWKGIVDERREQEAARAAHLAETVERDVLAQYPALAELAAVNRRLAEKRTGEGGLPSRISSVRDRVAATRAKLDETTRRFRSAQRRLRVGGLTEGMGLTLRQDFEWLPRPGAVARQIRESEELLSAAQLEQITIEEERFGGDDPQVELRALLDELGDAGDDPELAALAQSLIAARREAQDAVLADLSTLASSCVEYLECTRLLAEQTEAFRSYIEEHILWVRSAPQGRLATARELPRALPELLGSLVQPQLGSELLDGLRQAPLSTAFALLLVVVLVALRGRLVGALESLHERVRSYRTDSFGLTVRALLVVALLALPGPLLAHQLGGLLSGVEQALVRHLGQALVALAPVWFVLRFLLGLCSSHEAGTTHLRWRPSLVSFLRRELSWLEPALLVPLFLAVALLWDPRDPAEELLGVLFFAVAMGATSASLFRVLRPASPLWKVPIAGGETLLFRFARTWLVALALGPLVLAIIALAGYGYTATQFELRLRSTIGLGVGLLLVHSLLMRWLFLTRRKLAVAQALEARERREAERLASKSGEPAPPPFEADKLDIPAVDAQTRQLFRSSLILAALLGLFWIWSPVLPALRGLSRVELLPAFRVAPVDEAPVQEELAVAAPDSGASTPALGSPAGPTPMTALQAGDGGADAQASSPLPVVFTLADLLSALLLLALTTVAARNLPALLELALLERLPLEAGTRYAIATIVRYLILLLGISAISRAVGIGWSQVQWLAAALTFGLAFGLQEIFANFVSGIIILIERPIRVGDIVTVGDVEGRVTQLRMRATTIQDYSRRELLIPNKEFITTSIINWTLTDPVTRFTVRVGIAYGSDTDRARELLLDCARRHPPVLDDPAPAVVFRGFGESSLDFELRIFIANREVWAEIIDQLHMEIDKAFREANIEISFPQRDLHLRSVDPELLRAAGIGRPSSEEATSD